MAPADVILVNARGHTMDSLRPLVEAVAIRGNRIEAVGLASDVERLRGSATRVIDCEGRVLVPGFIDAHIHLFAYAANLVSLDCSPRAVRSVADIQRVLAQAATAKPSGSWLRGWGYNEFYLAEHRHPTRHDLDRAAPHHPVKLTHRSGHAWVLNALAMQRLGITSETPEPPGAVIERDASGELTGYFMEMEDDLSARGVPTLPEVELDEGLRLAMQSLLSKGITSIHEASPYGASAHWDRLAAMQKRGALPLRIYKMFGPGDFDALRSRDLFFGATQERLSVGAIKFMLNETSAQMLPDRDALGEQVYTAHRAGYQVAFHATTEAGVIAAADAVDAALRRSLDDARDIAALGLRLQDHRHRIEHCGVCPSTLAVRLHSLGIVVVTQPGFIAEHGERWLAEVSPEHQPRLYPVGALRRAGVRVAFGSDCPVAPADPFAALAAAVTRRAASGALVGQEHAVSVAEALAMHTSAGAYAASDEHDRGSIAVGKLADLVLLDRDLLVVSPEELRETRVVWTMVGGETVWEG
ncbi:MAG: amidohydrolase [Chloroflexi bacterium]|nr:amidohydrolase [Chloroflexota bacterium]